MAITVTWATKVINVPQADLTLVSGSVYELDLEQFRQDLNALQASEEGIWADTILEHNTLATVSGVTLARLIEIVNGYTVTFEDGQYAVNLEGANSNVADVTNVNQVSIRSFNTAGLVQIETPAAGLNTEQLAMLRYLWKKSGADPLNRITHYATEDGQDGYIRSEDNEVDQTHHQVDADTVTVTQQ